MSIKFKTSTLYGNTTSYRYDSMKDGWHKKWRYDFLAKLFAVFFGYQRANNFTKLSRYLGFREFIFRNHFSIPFSFEVFNTYWVQLSGSGEYVTTPSHIPKSGKLTFGEGKFWSCCHKTIKEGLEIAGFALRQT